MVSVVIPAYNEESVIASCLDALFKQNTKEEFEVILVNNNSIDKTVEIAKRFESKLNLRIISEKEKGRGAARNKGFKEACGEIILSTDADTKVPPEWIDYLLAELKKNNAIAVTGTCKIVDCGLFTNTLFNIFQPFSMRIYRLIFHHYWLSGFNFGIYKEAYEESGGFNRKLNAQEDIDLSFRICRIGKIQFISNLPVIFSGRRFQKGLIRGLIPYVFTFIGYFIYKNENVILPDVRD